MEITHFHKILNYTHQFFILVYITAFERYLIGEANVIGCLAPFANDLRELGLVHKQTRYRDPTILAANHYVLRSAYSFQSASVFIFKISFVVYFVEVHFSGNFKNLIIGFYQ
jgi:hypothetical protein